MSSFRDLFGFLRGSAGRHDQVLVETSSEFTDTGKRIVSVPGYKVELDLTGQRLAVSAPALEVGWREEDEGATAEPPLSATLGSADPSKPLSASILAQKAKIFDDGLYAAVEVAAQEGAGRHAGKAKLLSSLAARLLTADSAEVSTVRALLLGAARLGDVSLPALPPGVESEVQRVVADFLADELRSKPIGFYTWSERLGGIFRQDRLLQSPLKDRAGIDALSAMLRADPAARAAYEAHLRLIARLTNPLAAADLRSVLAATDHGTAHPPPEEPCFFPPSAAHETEIVKQLFGAEPIPDDFVLVEEMIRRIRSGALDLTPRPESGWYDHQTWALEPLVVPERMPEAARLDLDEEYRKLLLELFKGLMTLTRETHIKQLEIALTGMGLGGFHEQFILIAPALSAEPLPTFYLRRALSYRFVREVLEDCLGPGQIQGLHRLTQAGPVQASLGDELAEIEALFFGAHVAVSRELGLRPDPACGGASAARSAAVRFAAWTRRLASDPDLGQDVRAMVPVFYDIQRGKTKVWLFLGWSRRPATVSFAQPPRVTVLDSRGRPARQHPRISWATLFAELDYPVTAEVYVDRVLNRDEFRRLCDRCGSRREILRELGVVLPGEGDEAQPPRPRHECAQCGWRPHGDAVPAQCPRCGGAIHERGAGPP